MATKKKTEEETDGAVAETGETEEAPTEAVEAQAGHVAGGSGIPCQP